MISPWHVRRYGHLALVLLVVLLAQRMACAETYAAWIAGYPSISGADAEMLADPDSDGVKNLVEYALAGANPTVVDVQSFATEVFLQDQTADGTWGEPMYGRTVGALAVGSKRAIGMRWKARAGTSGIRIVPEADNRTLTNWLWGRSAIETWTAGDYTYARFASDNEVWGNQFMRLTVEVAD